jgi:hypothetical protein
MLFDMRSAQFELLHHNRKVVTSVPDHQQSSRPGKKPRGFWLSVGDSWAEWNLANRHDLEGLRIAHRVVLEQDARILELCERPDAIEFVRKYGFHDEEVVEWARVARAYQGIIVHNPKCFEHDFLTGWPRGWSCSSGCVWDASAVRSIDVIPNAMEERLLQAGLF